MFFFLSKIFSFLTAPLTWIFIFLLISIIQKKPKRRNRLLLVSILMLYVFSNEFFFNEVVRKWEVPAQVLMEQEMYDVGIVLGGAVSYDEQLQRMQVFRSFDRVVQAGDLYKKGHIKVLLISGGSGSITFPDVKEASLIKEYYLSVGIPEDSILVEAESRNTRENAVFSLEKLEQAGLDKSRLLLITSGYHLDRARSCFEKAGLNPAGFSTDRVTGPRRFQADYLFLPNAEILFFWNVVIHEWIGYVIYFLAGYV